MSMVLVEETVVECPHCGSSNEIAVDPSASRQRYVEECQVCSRAIDLRVEFDEGDLMVSAMAA